MANVGARSPEDVVYDDQRCLALIASDVDAVKGTVRLEGALCGVVHLDGGDGAAGLD